MPLWFTNVTAVLLHNWLIVIWPVRFSESWMFTGKVSVCVQPAWLVATSVTV